ncbi:conserved hypothethical protein (plasmid) [Ralstonia solanacearum CMR15]|nr:conserved hypothethical protein [Ralstonia solanacearum CMR15]
MAALPLKKPLKFGETTISKLTFRDHTTAEDYLAFDKRGGTAQRLALIASMTGTDEELVKRLHGVDYRRAAQMADELIEADEQEDEPRTADGDDPAASEAQKK